MQGDLDTSPESHVRALASEEMGGRLTGTEGERKAAAYLVRELTRLGAAPLPGAEGFRLPFEFAAGSRDTGSSLELVTRQDRRRFAGEDRVRALSFSSNARVTAPVVFAGYGLVVPESLGVAYDSYAGLDVEGRIVAVLRYFPEDVPTQRRVTLARYAGLRYKALAARERGARALLVLTGPRSPHAGKTVPMTFDTAVAGSGIAAVSAGGDVAEALFAGAASGSLEQIQARLDAGDPHAAGFELDGLELTIDARLARERREGINVVGRLPGREPASSALVMIGAHYDHLGHGSHGSSLAREDERGSIHPGADDNASGVAAVLAIAEALARQPARSNVVVAFWSGEELGLLGSSAFVQRGLLAQRKVAAYLNFDMVGRLGDGALAVQGAGSSDAWPELVRRASAPLGLELAIQPDPFLPTDSSTFNSGRVPALNLFTGAHADYHRPSDTADRIDYPGLARVSRFGERLVRSLADLPEPPRFAAVERAPGSQPGLGVLRAYTGTVPDYTAEAEGLALMGVADGGPAAAAGLRAGDVIVEFAGQKIANIYDYTYALEAAKIGEPAQVVFLRDGERREATLVPEARP